MSKRTKTPARPVSEIAREIRLDWGAKVNFAAKPYLDAMRFMNSVDDNYGMDDGRGIIARFLCNASTWRGDKAREIKKELNKMIK
jgi:hypothetical protein